jgi:hypothetical protein
MSDPVQVLIDALQSVWPQADATTLGRVATHLLRALNATSGSSTASLNFGENNNFKDATILIGNIAGGSITNDAGTVEQALRNVLKEFLQTTSFSLITSTRYSAELPSERSLNTFISYQQFFKPLLNPQKLFNHLSPFLGREQLIEQLDVFATGEQDIAILIGRGGIGKTRTLLAFTEQCSQNHQDIELRFVAEGVPITHESANELPEAPCIIVIDDAHRRDDLALLFAIQKQRSQPTKLLLAARPQARGQLNGQLSRAHYDTRQIFHLAELDTLGRNDVRALARHVLGEADSGFVDQLTRITRDSPLVTVIGGRLLAEKKLHPQLLERDQEFRDTVLARFEDILLGSIVHSVDIPLCRELLKLIAILSPLQLQEEAHIEAVSTFLKVEPRAMFRALDELEQSGALIRRGSSLRITPDVLSDHILHQACIASRGEITGYALLIFDTFRHLFSKSILRNLAELDWRIQRTDKLATDVLSHIWERMCAEFKDSSHWGRCQILDVLSNVAFYQPARTLDLIKFAIREPATVEEDQGIGKYFSSTHERVVQRLPRLLRDIGYNLDYLQQCCDILWKIGRDDSRPTNSTTDHPMRILSDLATYDLDKYYIFNEAVLDAAERWLHSPDAHAHLHSPLDVLDALLIKSGHSDYSEGYQVIMRPFLVNREQTQHLRTRALDLIHRCAQSGETNITLRAIASLAKALHPPVPYFSMEISQADYAQWIPEEERILTSLEALVTQTHNTLIHLRILEALAWPACSSQSESIQQHARDIIAGIPDTYSFRMMKILATANTSIWMLDDPGGGTHSERHRRWREQEQHAVDDFIDEFMREYPDPIEGLHNLHDVVESLHQHDIRPEILDFVMRLSEMYPVYVMPMIETLLENPVNHLSSYIAWLLRGVRQHDVVRALDFQRRIAESGDSTLAFSLTHVFRWGVWTGSLHSEDLETVQRLMAYDVPSISTTATETLAGIGHMKPEWVISLALNLEIGTDIKHAAALCTIFDDDHGIHPDQLTDAQLSSLLLKLTPVLDIDNYHILKILEYTARRLPQQTVDFLIDRLRREEEASKEFKAYPYSGLNQTLIGLAESSEYLNLLRIVRDCSLLEPTNQSRLVAELYHAVSLNYNDSSLVILNEWIDSGDPQKIQQACRLLREASQSFIFSQEAFTQHALEQAYMTGDECFQDVLNSLASTAIYGERSGRAGQPFPQDLLLRDCSIETLGRLSPSSPLREFYEVLVRRAEANITKSKQRDQELDEV